MTDGGHHPDRPVVEAGVLPTLPAATRDADSITVLETVALLDGPFSAFAGAVAARQVTLWVGSGISFGAAPGLASLILKALEHLRSRIDPGDPACAFKDALGKALRLSHHSPANIEALLPTPFPEWPDSDKICHGLKSKYADVLDIRVRDRDPDYMIWDAVDIRAEYGGLAEPTCAHLCIAILILEGFLPNIASANWDGLIEVALARFAGNAGGLLKVVVDPGELREPDGGTVLIKYHGCAVRCIEDPDRYRQFVTARRSQITGWRHDHPALATKLVSLASAARSMLAGISLQDSDLQELFRTARQELPWPWPCQPEAQGHVFCEEQIGLDQSAMLRVVYGPHYDANGPEIEASAHLRAWPEQVLLALVIKLLSLKLEAAMAHTLAGTTHEAHLPELVAGLDVLRDRVAAVADGDRRVFVLGVTSSWSNALALFRRGEFLDGADRYEALGRGTVDQFIADPNAANSGFGELSTALALLGRGVATGSVALTRPAAGEHPAALTATASWPGAPRTNILFASNPAAAIEMRMAGALANDNTVLIYSSKAEPEATPATPPRRTPSRAPGRTGRSGPRNISMRTLMRSEPDLRTLEKRFREEMVL